MRSINTMFVFIVNLFAQIAQLVEQRTENPRVTGSIPVLGTHNVFKRVLVLNEICVIIRK